MGIYHSHYEYALTLACRISKVDRHDIVERLLQSLLRGWVHSLLGCLALGCLALGCLALALALGRLLGLGLGRQLGALR